MSKIKPIFAVGVILLFIGLAVSPATAKGELREKITFAFREADGSLVSKTIEFTREELDKLDTLLTNLMDVMQSASSIQEVKNIVDGWLWQYGRNPGLGLLLRFFLRALDVNLNVVQMSPLRNWAFVMSYGYANKFFPPVLSWGYTNRLFPLRQNQIDLYRPLTLWYYSAGRSSNLLINSRTVIVDPYPFNVRSLTGRQIGLMRNFVGLYIYRHNTITDKSYTYFLGWSAGVVGLDLSPPLVGTW